MTPSCPSCNGPMVRRKNRKDGSSFWGCRKYPRCRGTRDASAETRESQFEDASESLLQVRVLWNDATLTRTGWSCRYTTAGGRLRSSPFLKDFSYEFRQCWIARTYGTYFAPESVRRVTGAIRKVIQRGSNPPVHPASEQEILGALGLDAYVSSSSLPGDLSVRLETDVFESLADGSPILPDPDFARDKEIPFDSGYEQHFIDDWVPRHLDPDAPRWFVPQASFDALTAALSNFGPSGRRVDFLVSAPFRSAFVVEIDGAQHQDSSNPDGERDRLLAQVGLEVVRVPTSEIDQGHGPNLERVKALWSNPQNAPNKKTLGAHILPVSIHRLTIALLDAIDAGFLRGPEWVVEVGGDPEVTPVMSGPTYVYSRRWTACGDPPSCRT